MISTFPRNPQRDDCYYFQPGISLPEWHHFGEQVDEGRVIARAALLQHLVHRPAESG